MGEHKYREKLPDEQRIAASTEVAKRVLPLRHLDNRPRSWPSVDDAGNLTLNNPDYVHGVVVTNRAERRAAQVEARRYGCDVSPDKAGKTRHGLRCPKYEPPEAERKRVVLKSDKVEEMMGGLLEQRQVILRARSLGKTLDLAAAERVSRESGKTVVYIDEVGEHVLTPEKATAPEGAVGPIAGATPNKPTEGATVPPSSDEVKP